MPGVKRPKARLIGAVRAARATQELGSAVKRARERRRMKQEALAARVGISQARLAAIEAGRGGGAPAEVWFALGEALGLYLRFEFGRDPQQELRDAAHLDVQELVARVAEPAGWKPEWESRSRNRWIDVRLEDRRQRRILIVECTNTLGDLGEAMRSSDHKVREAEQRAVAIGGEGASFAVGLVWVVRDTKANRQLVDRYARLLESRFTGSSVAWLKVLAVGGRMPSEPGLVWSDVRATRLFARRRAR
ncbi:MAG: helix-turn-helix domain-containing protein [Chloroflexota bacterium]|nr:helix-turn-helix domain-containing protein [Chloroflexota bacterium]